MYIILGYLCGFLSIAIGIFIQLAILIHLKSFGVYYLEPYTPFANLNSDITLFQKPIWKREYRSNFLKTKKPREEQDISMSWKNKDL